jgi:hypothetical protein
VDTIFRAMHHGSFSIISVNCNMWHDLAAVWACLRNVMDIKRLSIRISVSPAPISLLRLLPQHGNPWTGELVFQHQNSYQDSQCPV